MLFGSHFGAIWRLVAKVRMKLPSGRERRFRGFRASRNRKISILFSEGVLGSSVVAFFHVFCDFGCPPELKKEAILKLASAFFEVRDFDDFRGVRLRSR